MKAIPTTHKPDISILQIMLTYRCNLTCKHCSSFVEQAPSNESMTVERIESVVRESIELKWPWKRIALHGGEPTMHPQFEAVCGIFAKYRREHNPEVVVSLTTNGVGRKVAEGIKIAEGFGMEIGNSEKEAGNDYPDHVPLSYSPADLDEDYYLGCFQSSICGIAVTNQGYYECSPAASAYRVLGYEPLAVKLADVTVEKLAAGFALHCKHCGYARKLPLYGDPYAPQGSFKRRLFNLTLRLASKPKAPNTKTWQDAFDKYRRSKTKDPHI